MTTAEMPPSPTPRSTLCSALALLTLVSLGPVQAQPNAGLDRVTRAIERGDAHRSIGDTISALAFYRDAIQAAPRRGEGYAALGALYLELGEPHRALEVYEAGVRTSGRGEALWLGYAHILDLLGQPARALSALRQWVRLEPGSLSGLRALAEACERQGAFVEALAARRALLDHLGSHADARALDEADELDEARAQVRAVERILGDAERARAPAACMEASDPPSQVERALSRCP